jgi:hypothetical protein
MSVTSSQPASTRATPREYIDFIKDFLIATRVELKGMLTDAAGSEKLRVCWTAFRVPTSVESLGE